jgi:hypothetical protein
MSSNHFRCRLIHRDKKICSGKTSLSAQSLKISTFRASKAIRKFAPRPYPRSRGHERRASQRARASRLVCCRITTINVGIPPFTWRLRPSRLYASP